MPIHYTWMMWLLISWARLDPIPQRAPNLGTKLASALARLHANVFLEVAGLPPQKLLTYFPELERSRRQGDLWIGFSGGADDKGKHRSDPAICRSPRRPRSNSGRKRSSVAGISLKGLFDDLLRSLKMLFSVIP